MKSSVRLGAAFATFALAGCQAAEQMTFHFKWHEGDAGFKWFAECLGEHAHGTNLKGRIEIVDRATAKRMAQRGPDAKIEDEDLAGLRCIPPVEVDPPEASSELPAT